MNTKLHAVTDADGRPLSFFMTAGQVSDYTGAAALLDDLPKAQWMLADRGYDADWYRDALQSRQEPSGVTIIVAMLPTCVAMTGRPAWSASMITIGIHSAL